MEWGADADHFLEGLPKVDEESNNELQQTLSLQELHTAMMSMENGNWRPVSLLCSEYKFLSKALAIRLSKVYCIPNRSILDNIALIRDVLDVSNLLGINSGLISLDQEKAFARVEHLFLWNTLEAFGFSPSFISMIKAMYCNIESVLKINGGLSAPFRVQRGVKAGMCHVWYAVFPWGPLGSIWEMRVS